MAGTAMCASAEISRLEFARPYMRYHASVGPS